MKRTRYLNLFAASILSLSISAAPQLTAESEVLIEQLKHQIEGTIIAIGKNEAKVGHIVEDLNLTIELPAKSEANLGILLDVDRPNEGFKILSVSPGSTAEQLELEVGTNIVSFNEMPIKDSTSARVLNQIQMLSAGDRIKFTIDNGARVNDYEATIEGRFIPDIKLEVGLQSTKVASNMVEAGSSSCGYVSVLFGPPRSKSLYSSYINKIGDKATIRGRHSFKLSSAKHQVYVHELIDAPSLRRSGGIKNSKLLEIDIKPNKMYHIAAKYDRKKKSRRHNEEYWEPVVWKVTDSECEL